MGNVFNLGQSLTAGQRYQAGQLGLKENQNIIANRKKANDIRRQYEAMPDQIDQLEQQGLFDEAAKLRNNYIQTKKSAIEMFENVGHMVAPEDYQQFRSDMIQSGSITPDLMPVQYKKNWWRPEAQKQRGNLSTLTRKWGGQGAVMSQDLVTQDGQVIWTGQPYKDKKSKSGSGSGKPFRMSASDSNSIAKAVGAIFGLWDPITNQYKILNRDQTKQVASINEEASKIYNANQGIITHAESVARAARRMNIKIPNLEKDPKSSNPNG